MHIFITSDDIEWVKKHIGNNFFPGTTITYVSRPSIKDYEEITIMQSCDSFILANSTFCWWSAWLSESAEKRGKKKIVIGPKRWVADPSVDTKDVLPEEWIRV